MNLFISLNQHTDDPHLETNITWVHSRKQLVHLETISETSTYRTYKYWRFFSWPSWGTRTPDNCAFPRSLSKKETFRIKHPHDSEMHKWGFFSSTYTLITLLSLLQVTWNHVHGFTRVGSQLCNTLFASLKLWRRLYKASPTNKKVTIIVSKRS